MNVALMTWMPQPYTSRLSCFKCASEIKAGMTFALPIHELDFTSTNWQHNVTCLNCELPLILENMFKTENRFSKAVRNIVRSELHEIFKKELADPNGEWGPGSQEF